MRTLKAENVGAMIDRVGREAHPLQFVREVVVNAVQAGARCVRFGVDDGRLFVVDDGRGMSRSELARYMGSIGVSSSDTLGDPHGNFGQGSRVSTLWWNPDGVIVHSRRDGQSSTIRLAKTSDGYGWEFLDGFRPPRGSRMGRSGTVLVFMGDDGATGAGPYGKFGGAEYAAFLETRFFNLPVAVEIFVGANGRPRSTSVKVRGLSAALGDARARGTVDVSRGTRVHWWTHPGVEGSVSVLYGDELFMRATSAAAFARFGAFTKQARSDVTIVVEPPRSGTDAPGVFPTGARGGLMWTDGESLDELLAAWGSEFRDQLPGEIAALNEADADDGRWRGKVAALMSRFRALRARASAANPREGATSRARGRSGAKRNPRTPKFPDVRWVSAADMGDGYGCRFVAGNPGTILMNEEFPVFREAVAAHRKRYPRAPASIVEGVVRSVFAAHAVATACHVAAMSGHSDWRGGRINQLLSPEALTAAMFGILNVEPQIRRGIAGRVGAA